MEKQRRIMLQTAALLAAISGCGAFSTGRCISAFYAQTGRYSWPGIAVSCLVFGFLVGGVVRLKRKTGAGSLPALYRGLFGKRAGAAFVALHAAFFAACASVLLACAADTAALLLPVHNADLMGIFAALALALWISRAGAPLISRIGGIYFLLLICMITAFAAFGRAPSQSSLHFYVKLRLEDKPWAAVLLALVHASLAAGMCTAAAVRLFPMNIRPLQAGLASAAAFALILAAGNAVFCAFPPEINALKYPFIALSGGWGKAGYYFCALMRCGECVISLCGIFCFLPDKAR